MNAENPVLTLIAKLSAFELVIGLNGYIWIKGDSIKTTFHLSDLILRLDGKSPDHQRQLVLEFLKDF
jgi:exosome complex RNA-binding protein Rrp4